MMHDAAAVEGTLVGVGVGVSVGVGRRRCCRPPICLPARETRTWQIDVPKQLQGLARHRSHCHRCHCSYSHCSPSLEPSAPLPLLIALACKNRGALGSSLCSTDRAGEWKRWRCLGGVSATVSARQAAAMHARATGIAAHLYCDDRQIVAQLLRDHPNQVSEHRRTEWVLERRGLAIEIVVRGSSSGWWSVVGGRRRGLVGWGGQC